MNHAERCHTEATMSEIPTLFKFTTEHAGKICELRQDMTALTRRIEALERTIGWYNATPNPLAEVMTEGTVKMREEGSVEWQQERTVKCHIHREQIPTPSPVVLQAATDACDAATPEPRKPREWWIHLRDDVTDGIHGYVRVDKCASCIPVREILPGEEDEIERLRAEITRMTSEWVTEVFNCTTLTGKLEAEQSRRMEAEKEVERLKAELKDLREELDVTMEEWQSTQAELKRTKEEVEEVTHNAIRMESQHNESTKALTAEMRAEVNRIQVDMEFVRGGCINQVAENGKLREEIDRQAASIAHYIQSIEKLIGECADYAETIDILKKKLAVENERLRGVLADSERAQADLAKLTAERDVLREFVVACYECGTLQYAKRKGYRAGYSRTAGEVLKAADAEKEKK